MAFTQEEILELILEETHAITDAMVEDARIDRRLRKLERDRDYYLFVRMAPARREQENAAARERRQAARRARARARPPCPRCGGDVTRGETVPRGCKLPKYCTRKCMRAAVWARYAAKKKAQEKDAA